MLRPTSQQLLEDPWMLDFRETLRDYEAAELAVDPPAQIPPEEEFENAKVARQAAILQEKEVERIQSESPSGSGSPAAESTPSTP
jgi:mitogen-activated protein kinase kinase kinase